MFGKEKTSSFKKKQKQVVCKEVNTIYHTPVKTKISTTTNNVHNTKLTILY